MESFRPTIEDLCVFLDGSPSPFHVVATVASRLLNAGFAEVRDDAARDALPTSGFVVRDGSIIAWRSPPGAAPSVPFRIIGAHTDSPCLRVKPIADGGGFGFKQINVEVYGGILNNSWLDRDLGIAGRITLADGTTTNVSVVRPIARIPQLAIHLDRTANERLELDAQRHLQPVWGTGMKLAGEFADWIGSEAACEPPAFWELSLFDVQRAAVLGADESLLASGRLDNQLSCWAATSALIASNPVDAIAVIVLNDHEEVGSESTTGAAGPFLERTLEQHVASRGGVRGDLLRALASSSCVSADNAHAVHPNYSDRHDPDHGPIVNAGPVIKLNSNMRYATSSKTAAMFRRACEAAGVPHQLFVSRNNVACGTTIGPVTATRLGIDTVDVGIPQLSMHSARELCGVSDPISMALALQCSLSM